MANSSTAKPAVISRPLRKVREAHFASALSGMQEVMLRAQLRGINLPPIVPYEECGEPHRPPDIEERPSVDRLGQYVTIYDPAPPKCSVCGCELFPSAFFDYSGMTAEEVDQIDWDRENFRSVKTCDEHPEAMPIWPPTMEVRYRFGEPGATLEVTQGNETVHPLLVSPDGLQLLSKVLIRLEAWIQMVQDVIAANADRDYADEAKTFGWLYP